jgi:hypothetical protein
MAVAILQASHRFRTKLQLWACGGLGIQTHSTADHRYVGGQLQPSKRPVLLRELNRNHNHDLKNIFKGAAIIAATKPGPFLELYADLVRASGRRWRACPTIPKPGHALARTASLLKSGWHVVPLTHTFAVCDLHPKRKGGAGKVDVLSRHGQLGIAADLKHG